MMDMSHITTPLERIASMEAYMESLRKMSPEDAKKSAEETLKKSGILDDSGNLNPLLFRESRYINN